MASLGEYCTRNCLYSKNSFNILSISQPCNARQFRRSIVTKKHSTWPTFCPMSTGGKMLLINIIQKSKEDQWRLWCTDDGSCGIAPSQPSPIPSASKLIHEFYTAINTKNSEELNESLDPLLSEDCVYQDLFFYIPFQGKKVFFFSVLHIYSIILNAISRHKLGHTNNITSFFFLFSFWLSMSIASLTLNFTGKQ